MALKRSPRILLLVTDLEIGGTPTVVRELARRLAGLTHVHVSCLGRFGPVAQQIRELGVGVTALDAAGAWDLRIVPRLVRLCRQERIDTIFSFLVHANAVAALAGLLLGDVRLIQSIQTTQAYPAWHWCVQRTIWPMAEAVAAPTESVAEMAQARCGVPRSKLVVIPNAVEEGCGDGQVGRWGGGKRVGFIGRLDRIKRVPDLLAAVRALREGRGAGQITLDVFGDGADRGRIEREIDRLGLGDSVVMHGMIGDPREALRAIDVLVLPSEAEGFGLVLIEAMAAGVPVVATDAPGIRDVVRNEQTGLLVPVGRPERLAEAIGRALGDAELRDRLVAAGRREVEERFSWRVVWSRYRQLLRC